MAIGSTWPCTDHEKKVWARFSATISALLMLLAADSMAMVGSVSKGRGDRATAPDCRRCVSLEIAVTERDHGLAIRLDAAAATPTVPRAVSGGRFAMSMSPARRLVAGGAVLALLLAVPASVGATITGGCTGEGHSTSSDSIDLT